MTRKRYIKLHMAAGVDRNNAAALAKADRDAGVPYAAGWVFFKSFLTPPPDPGRMKVINTKNGPWLSLEVHV